VAECRYNPHGGGPLYEDLKAVLAVLSEQGLEITAHELRQCYKVARTFPPGIRCLEISWECHLEARDPETLALVLKDRGPAATSDE
jgi:hypothetical protein